MELFSFAALAKHLEANPNDDQARFGLGITQFLQAYEQVGQSLYRHGLRTERSFVRPAPQIRELWPQNPKPEKIDYAAARKIVQTFVDDTNRAEATLAVVKDERVNEWIPNPKQTGVLGVTNQSA